MEDGLWLTILFVCWWENCLNPCFSGRWSLTNMSIFVKNQSGAVLILVLVEDGLWQLWYRFIIKLIAKSLNPCFSGRWSLTYKVDNNRHTTICLNPCFSGRWSLTSCLRSLRLEAERSLNPCCSGRWSLTIWRWHSCIANSQVLILVVVEDGLWLDEEAPDDNCDD